MSTYPSVYSRISDGETVNTYFPKSVLETSTSLLHHSLHVSTRHENVQNSGGIVQIKNKIGARNVIKQS